MARTNGGSCREDDEAQISEGQCQATSEEWECQKRFYGGISKDVLSTRSKELRKEKTYF